MEGQHIQCTNKIEWTADRAPLSYPKAGCKKRFQLKKYLQGYCGSIIQYQQLNKQMHMKPGKLKCFKVKRIWQPAYQTDVSPPLWVHSKHQLCLWGLKLSKLVRTESESWNSPSTLDEQMLCSIATSLKVVFMLKKKLI